MKPPAAPHRPGYDAMADLRPLALDGCNAVNGAVVLVLWAAGALHDQPRLWWATAATLVCQICAAHFSTALAFQWLARRCGARIQAATASAPREHVAAEVLQTVLGFGLVLAPLLATAATNSSLGRPTALTWDLRSAMPGFAVDWPAPLQAALYGGAVVVGAALADAYNYWKHRAFHHELLWPLHKHHHAHRNPSALTGYAISPAYSLATFWPLLLTAWPAMRFWVPMYAPFLAFYLLLNHYLHCGYILEALEGPLAPLCIMTSAWHNTHHERGRRGWDAKDQTFGEMTTLWDHWMGTHPHADSRAAAGGAGTEKGS